MPQFCVLRLWFLLGRVLAWGGHEETGHTHGKPNQEYWACFSVGCMGLPLGHSGLSDLSSCSGPPIALRLSIPTVPVSRGLGHQLAQVAEATGGPLCWWWIGQH